MDRNKSDIKNFLQKSRHSAATISHVYWSFRIYAIYNEKRKL